MYEYDDPRIPLTVKAQSEAQIKKGVSIYMVQFFDKTRSWCVSLIELCDRRLTMCRQYLKHDKLKMLGEHEGMLSPC